MKLILTATIEYLTNHVINHVPSHTIRHAWYRKVVGWRIGPKASILLDNMYRWLECELVDGR
jgi:hypothetical protein